MCECVRACVRACVCTCVRACVRAIVRAVRCGAARRGAARRGAACVRACVRALVVTVEQLLYFTSMSYHMPPAYKPLHLQNTAAVVALPSHLFASGLIYFELPARAFAGDDGTGNNCYVIHNNWIVSKAAKVYRFKEHLMWTLDDGQYYSSTTRRYLVYDNPPVGLSTPPSLAVQLDALRCALAIGQTLNRTVILPSFRCDRNKMCALNSFLRVTAFDEVFRDEYREHVFLRNPMVPKSVKESRSKVFLIRSDAANSTTHHPDELQVLMPNNQRVGADSLEITTWFQDAKESVLSFHCLYGAFSSFINEKQQAAFNTRLEAGFKLAKYRQFR